MYDFQEQFYQVMTRLRANSRSRAASTQEPKDDARVTEIINGLLVSRPAKKVVSQKEPEIIDLQEYAKSSKAASVQSIKVKVIADFINGPREVIQD